MVLDPTEEEELTKELADDLEEPNELSENYYEFSSLYYELSREQYNQIENEAINDEIDENLSSEIIENLLKSPNEW